MFVHHCGPSRDAALRRTASAARRASVRRSLRSAALLVAALAACAAGAEPADEARSGRNRPFGESVGLVVKFAQGQPQSQLDTLSELHVRWVRDVLNWSDIEPQPGRFVDFSAAFKQRLAYYRDHRIGLVALLSLSNETAYPPGPDAPLRGYDPQRFGRYAATAARMLRASGVRFVLELGNEPHNSPLQKIAGGAWNGHAPSPWVDHYVRMAAEAVRQTKAVDPSIKLLADDDMWVVHYWFLEAGLPPALDGLAVHPYTIDVPELTAVAADTDWTQPFKVVDEDRSFGSAVRRLQRQATTKLHHTPEIWVTEWGWPIGAGPVDKFVAEDVLAGYVPRAFILGAASGATVVCWFSSQDSVDGPMGLIDNQGHRRKSYLAFKTMSEQLGAYSLVRQVAGERRPGKGLQAYLFAHDRERKLVLWTADAKTVEVTLVGRSATDALGHRLTDMTGPRVGLERWVIGPSPIYVTGNWTDEFFEHFAKNEQ